MSRISPTAERKQSQVSLEDSIGNLSLMSNVSFGTIEIQEYPMVLGDNPSTSSGPSVELDWEAQSKIIIEDLDKYESQKPPKREMNQLSMPSERRTKILIESGHSMREIRETTKQRDSLRRKSTSSIKLPKVLNKFLSKWRKYKPFWAEPTMSRLRSLRLF